MKKTLLSTILLFVTFFLFAQRKVTTSAVVAFDATTAIDNQAKAENKTVIAAFDTKTGVVQFEASVKNFAFGNPTMQNHFNGSQWLNSDKFPKMTFNGKVNDLSKVNFDKDGSYTVSISGDLMVKDISKPLNTSAIITVTSGVINAASDFSITLADYGISGASMESGKIAKEPKISVKVELN